MENSSIGGQQQDILVFVGFVDGCIFLQGRYQSDREHTHPHHQIQDVEKEKQRTVWVKKMAENPSVSERAELSEVMQRVGFKSFGCRKKIRQKKRQTFFFLLL